MEPGVASGEKSPTLLSVATSGWWIGVFRKIEWAEEAGCDIESGGNGPGGQWFGLYTGKVTLH